MPSPFTRKTLSFLRALKRNNDRDWFRARKGDYELHVRQPMIALIERLARDFATFAPEMVADPKVSMYRIYRDTRFSADKTPLKTHVSAHFPDRRFGRGEGAGLYLEIAPGWVWIGGGIYMPSPQALRSIRAHVAATHPGLRRIVTARGFTGVMGALHGDQLTRVPRGYPADHAAADYLRYKQFLAGRECAAELATSAQFHRELLRTFKATLPLVRFLNAALLRDLGEAAALPAARDTRDLTTAVIPRAPAPMW